MTATEHGARQSCSRVAAPVVGHGLAEIYPHRIIFSTSVGAAETSGGKGAGRIMLDVWSCDHPHHGWPHTGGSASMADRHSATWNWVR